MKAQTQQDIGCQSLVVIGAPRSGTNMLRDVLTHMDGMGTWPCDEINYIWRHGNVRYPSDQIPADKATSAVSRYIRGKFDAIRRSSDLDVVVEKTCANCLRVPFVDRVLPEAKYIHIYRDGIDATGSARKRWTADLDLPYLMKKVRFVPPTDLPYYAVRYLWTRIYRVFSRDKRLAFWGPKLHDMQSILEKHTLEEVCAIQWQRCVDAADETLSSMPDGKVIWVKYEDFVQNPEDELARILDFMGRDAGSEDIANAVAGVSSKSMGKGRQAFDGAEIERLETL